MKDSQMKILVVDDVKMVRLFIKDLLELYDLGSEFAANGKEAIEVWEKDDFKAILMDLDMPVMGGVEATRIIRRREREKKRDHTPIIAVSGRVKSTTHYECSEVGMDGVIAKPMTIDEVMNVILPLVR